MRKTFFLLVVLVSATYANADESLQYPEQLCELVNGVRSDVSILKNDKTDTEIRGLLISELERISHFEDLSGYTCEGRSDSETVLTTLNFVESYLSIIDDSEGAVTRRVSVARGALGKANTSLASSSSGACTSEQIRAFNAKAERIKERHPERSNIFYFIEGNCSYFINAE